MDLEVISSQPDYPNGRAWWRRGVPAAGACFRVSSVQPSAFKAAMARRQPASCRRPCVRPPTSPVRPSPQSARSLRSVPPQRGVRSRWRRGARPLRRGPRACALILAACDQADRDARCQRKGGVRFPRARASAHRRA